MHKQARRREMKWGCFVKKSGKWGFLFKKVENEGVFVKKWKMGIF